MYPNIFCLFLHYFMTFIFCMSFDFVFLELKSAFITKIPLHLCACTQSFSCVQLFATLWTVAYQAPLSKGFSQQDYWSGLPFPPPQDLPDPGIEPASLISPALAGRFFTISATWEAPYLTIEPSFISLLNLLWQVLC